MISIVVPVYNKEKFIEETIKSVLAQTFKKFELILVNDGSVDNSLNIMEKNQDVRIRIVSIKNSGVSIARNIGIKEAKYDYISFLDADDWWESTFLEEIIKGIKKYPNYKVFATGRCRVFKDKIVYYQNSFLPEKGAFGIVDYIKVISKNLPPIHSSNVVIYKDELLKRGLFNPNQKLHEDHDLWLRICKVNDIVFVNKNLSYYRKDIVNSASNSIYKANDFLLYLRTLKDVKNSISERRNIFFKKYYLKFIIISFLKNYKYYNKAEEKKIRIKIFEIIKFPYSVIIFSTRFLPFKKMIYFYSKIKK
jgi:glycosyltransferase involved in cell wall biosynthesis